MSDLLALTDHPEVDVAVRVGHPVQLMSGQRADHRVST